MKKGEWCFYTESIVQAKHDGKRILTTTNSVDGYVVKKYLGVITQDIVYKAGLYNEALSAVVDFGNLFLNPDDAAMNGVSDEINTARKYVLSQFEEKAEKLGANAVIGIDLETAYGSTISRVSINGTAVRIEKDISSQNEKHTEILIKNPQTWLNISDCIVTYYVSTNSYTIRLCGESKRSLDGLQINADLKTMFNEKLNVGIVPFTSFDAIEDSALGFMTEEVPIMVDQRIFHALSKVDICVSKAIIANVIYDDSNMGNIGKAGFDIEDYLDDINQLENTGDILQYLEKLNIENATLQDEIIPELKKRATIEKMYGNSKKKTIDMLKERMNVSKQ